MPTQCTSFFQIAKGACTNRCRARAPSYIKQQQTGTRASVYLPAQSRLQEIMTQLRPRRTSSVRAVNTGKRPATRFPIRSSVYPRRADRHEREDPRRAGFTSMNTNNHLSKHYLRGVAARHKTNQLAPCSQCRRPITITSIQAVHT